MSLLVNKGDDSTQSDLSPSARPGTLLAIFNEIASDASRKHKEAVLLREKGNIPLKNAFKYAYDLVNYSYFITTDQFKDSVVPVDASFAQPFGAALIALEALNHRLYTGHAARDFCRETAAKLNDEDREVFYRILDRDLKVGCTSSTANKVWPGLVEEWPVLLAQPDDEKTRAKIQFPCFAEEKCDGMRINAVVVNNGGEWRVEFRSRNGMHVDCGNSAMVTSLIRMAEFQRDSFVFDGELVARRNGATLDRKTSNGICNKAIRGTISNEERELLVFVMWDMIPYEEFNNYGSEKKYWERNNIVRDTFQATDSSGRLKIDLVQQRVCDNWEQINQFYAEIVSKGGEGLIIKNRHMLWKDHRSPDCVKLKEELDGDFEVVGWEEGTGKYVGKMGALVCQNRDGSIKFNVGTGFSDEERVALTPEATKGKIITVTYNAVIDDKVTKQKSLFLPRFVCIRNDKTVAE